MKKIIKNITFKKGLRIAVLGAAAFLLAGCGAKPVDNYRVQLEVWGTFDDSDAYEEIFNAYEEMNPHVQISYRKLPVESYKQDVVDALASGSGPDIFLVRNAWIGDFANKMLPAPEGLIPEKTFRDNFPDVAAHDFLTPEGSLYALPVSIDSLALYYNKDIFNANGIARPPATWEEVEQLVPRLTSVDSFGNVEASAIALGTSQNINRSTDILTALFYQKDSAIYQEGSKQINLTDGATEAALTFYSQFSDIRSPLYTWNPNLHYSLDAFYEGRLAMMVNYSWQYGALKQKNAKLNIGVAPLPQFQGTAPANQANYWGYGVTKNKTYPEDVQAQSGLTREQYEQARGFESWQFLRYFAFAKSSTNITLQNAFTGNTADFGVVLDPAKTYLERTGKPAARRDLIIEQQGNVTLAPFASGNLIAKNWFQGDVEAAEGVLAELIDAAYSGRGTFNEVLQVAAQRLRVLMQ
jgi:ABC-type glycerol-3-phosphate transport system substrate-binding protein